VAQICPGRDERFNVILGLADGNFWIDDYLFGARI
jgi:hypothetical protein